MSRDRVELSVTDAWWEALYDEDLADILLERIDPQHTRATVDFILSRLALPEGSRIFDQCCGIGSLSIPLAKRGYRVLGLDQAAVYIERARGQTEGLAARFVVGDAFDFVAPEPCDGAINWWTSFGYAEGDADNLRMLRRVFESLRPGARFLLDTMNGASLLRGFLPHVVTERGGTTLWRQSELDLARGRLLKTWTYFLPDGGRKVHKTSVRLYMPHELVGLLEAAGFVEIELYGGIGGEALSMDSGRCICAARKS